MKIKRFFASDMRQALRQVRESLGPDAVILSNKSVEGGVELVAAKDYDETAFISQQEREQQAQQSVSAASELHHWKRPVENEVSQPKAQITPTKVEWTQDPTLVEMRREMKAMRRMMENQLSELAWHEMGSRQPLRRELLRRLMTLDISPDIAVQLVDRVQDADNPDQAWRKALNLLAGEIPIAGESLIDEGGVVALVGPTGVGKTTTIAKLAARYVLRHGHRGLALISTDSYRIGAQEQLHTYARILDVTIRSAATVEELSIALNALSDKRLVLVDSAGMSQRDVRLSEQLSLIGSANRMVKRYLTLSATTQQSAMEQAAKAFGACELSGCILTKVDEAASLGGAVSAAVHNRIPLAFFTDGQRVPEDIHLARANTLISRAVSLGQEAGGDYNDAYLSLAIAGVGADAHG